MIILTACVTGFLLDLILGDPSWIYHPIRVIGNLISALEKKLYVEEGDGKTLRTRGTFLWIGTVSISTAVPCMALFAAWKIHPILYFLLQSFWCWQILATRSLKMESMKVYTALKTGSLENGRKAVSMIVGRDTKELSREGVVKAAVETVAENTSDGIIAPLFYLMIGGAGAGFFYKAVNTMDSMVGYKNDRYQDFGRTAARMDDLFNLIPARFSALLMLAATGILGIFDRRHYDVKHAWKIYVRDRRKHKSPNAAQTESVCAGALSVQLAGNAWYFGKLHEKPFIGDDIRAIEEEDIKRACALLYVTAALGVLIFGVVRWILI